jgi:bifunctional DNA-binding transcriptional regulator/antitoxin component of YhaV-PrlF toxin-antitoxin module
VIPAAIRARQGWHEGTALIAIETDSGVVLIDRARAEEVLRLQLAGVDLVAELLRERRAAAASEDRR